MVTRIAIFILSVATSLNAGAGAGICFGPNLRFFDELRLSGKDTLTSAWYLRAGNNDTIYQSEFSFSGGDSANQATQESVEAQCDEAATEDAPLVTIDIESWSESTQTDRQTIAARFTQILEWCKPRLNADQMLGVYEYAPSADYYNAILGDGAPGYETWQGYNDDMNFLAAADVVYPSIYLVAYEASPYTNTIAYANAQMSEAQRLAPGKRIIPFLRLTYTENSDMSGGISCITTDNPASVTTADTHNIQTGYTVYMRNITGSNSIENVPNKVTRVDSTHFTIDGVDGSTLPAAVASASCGTYSSGGDYVSAVPAGQMRALLGAIDDYTDEAVIWSLSSTSGIVYSENDPSWSDLKEYVNCR